MTKKRVIAVLTAMLMLLSATLPVSAALSGDVNGDKRANVTDALLTFAAASGRYAMSSYEVARADVNRDHLLSVQDALLSFAAASGRETSAPADVSYDVRYVYLPITPYELAPTMILNTRAEWQEFLYSDPAVDPACYDVYWSYETQSVIALPITTDAYVAAVSADDETLYISLVTAGDSADLQGYAFVTVDKESLSEREVTIVPYRDDTDYVQTTVMANATGSGQYKRMDPTLITDVKELEAFSEAYYEAPLSELPMFDHCDEAFFEENLLVWAGYVAPYGGCDMEILSCVVHESAVYVHRALTVLPYDAVGMTVVQEFPMMMSLSRDGYRSQELVLIDHMNVVEYTVDETDPTETVTPSGSIAYETLYSEGAACSSMEENTAVIVRSYDEWLCHAAASTVTVEESYFDSHALVVVETYFTSAPPPSEVMDVRRDDSELNVLIGMTKVDASLQVLYREQLVLSVSAADVDGVDTVTRTAMYIPG